MKRLVLVFLLVPVILLGQNEPVVFSVGGSPEETQDGVDSTLFVDDGVFNNIFRRTGLPADDIGKWDLYENQISEEALIFIDQDKRRLPMKYRDFVYYPKINMSGNDLKTLRFNKIGCGTDTLILRNCKIDKIKIAHKKFTFRLPITWNADVVDLSDNLLTSMNEVFSVSPNMRVLDLSENRIMNVANTQKLVELDLSENDIESINKSFIKKGNALMILDLSKNDIEKLPRCFKHATVLEELNLADNQLSRINCNFSKCTNLSRVDLRGNPMTIEYINELRSRWQNIEFLF